jgi:hypothetical protein
MPILGLRVAQCGDGMEVAYVDADMRREEWRAVMNCSDCDV